jgi:opacity protein-like surface antigen
MFGKATAAAALVGSLFVPAIASAQYGDTGDSERPTIHVFGQVGASMVGRDLNVEKTANLKGGMAFGGGVGMQVNPNLAFRVALDYSPTTGEGLTSPYYEQAVNRTFYGADMHVRHVTERGIAPYFALGLGGVSVSNPDDDGFNAFSTFAGKGAFGLDYLPKSGKLSYFGQGTMYLYEFKEDVFERWQTDMLWTLGVKYRLSK